MSSRTRSRRDRKKRRIFLIALLAVAIAETGYILYAFGILSGGGVARQRVRPLEVALRIACLYTLGSEPLCERDVAATLLSNTKYIVIRYVNLLELRNVTEFIYSTMSIAHNNTIELVDVFLTPSQELASSIRYEVSKVIESPHRAYVTYPITLSQAGDYYAALLNELILILRHNVTVIGNVTRLECTVSRGNITLVKLMPRGKVNYSASLAMINLTYIFRKPMYVVRSNATQVERQLGTLLTYAINKTSIKVCRESNKTVCSNADVLARLYLPLISRNKVYGINVYMLVAAGRVTNRTYIYVTFTGTDMLKVENVSGAVIESRPIELVIVGLRTSGKIAYALVAPTQREVVQMLR